MLGCVIPYVEVKRCIKDDTTYVATYVEGSGVWLCGVGGITVCGVVVWLVGRWGLMCRGGRGRVNNARWVGWRRDG